MLHLHHLPLLLPPRRVHLTLPSLLPPLPLPNQPSLNPNSLLNQPSQTQTLHLSLLRMLSHSQTPLLRKRNTSVRRVNAHLLQVVTWLVIRGYIPVRGTTSVPSLVVKRDVVDKTIYSNSECHSPHALFFFFFLCLFDLIFLLTFFSTQPPLSYRIHLSPGSRRSNSASTRAAIQRAMSNSAAGAPSLAAQAQALSQAQAAQVAALGAPPLAPPPLAHAHAPHSYPHAPPPLAHAHSFPGAGDRSSAERSPDIRYSNGGGFTSADGNNGLMQSPHSSTSTSPVIPSSSSSSAAANGSSSSGGMYGQGTYTFAPQSQVPILQGHAANTTVYSPYATGTTSTSNYQFPQHQRTQSAQSQSPIQPQSATRTSHSHSHSHSVTSTSGTPSPGSTVRELQQSSHQASPTANEYPSHSNNSTHTPNTPSSATMPLSGNSYSFSIHHQQQPQVSRYPNPSPPPILAPIRRESHAGNPYPQVTKGFAT